MRRQPGALPRPQGASADDAHRRRTGDAGADAHGAANDPAAAALQLDSAGSARCRPTSRLGLGERRQADGAASCCRRPRTSSCARRAAAKTAARLGLADDTLAWKARAALRADDGKPRWQQVDAGDQRDERRPSSGTPRGCTGRRARLQALAARLAGRRSAARRAAASCSRASPASMNFYGMLAAEELGQPHRAAGQAGAADRRRARRRALRNPGLDPRAAADRASACATRACASGTTRCAAWATANCWRPRSSPATARCGTAASTPASGRKAEIDIDQRFPMPFRDEVVAHARARSASIRRTSTG